MYCWFSQCDYGVKEENIICLQYGNEETCHHDVKPSAQKAFARDVESLVASDVTNGGGAVVRVAPPGN